MKSIKVSEKLRKKLMIDKLQLELKSVEEVIWRLYKKSKGEKK